MKVLHVFKVYLPDSFTGVEHVIWEIAEGTAQFDIQATVFSLSKTPTYKPIQIGRHHASSAREDLFFASNSITLTGLPHFDKLCAEADLIHYHFPWPTMDVLHFASCARHKPSIVTYHSDIVKQKTLLKLYNPLMNTFLGSMDAIVATSPNYVESSETLRRFKNNVRVIPLAATSVEATPVDPERVAYWHAKIGPKFMLFLGAFRYYKGLPYLVQAAKETGLPVVIAGGGDQSILGGSVPKNVFLTGKVSEEDKDALMSMCTVFVLPSHLRSEAFGIVLLEAANAGKPMISCEMGTGTSYVNIHGETGIVVPPANAKALAGAMKDLWDNPALATQYGIAARLRAKVTFDPKTISKSYAELYHQVFNRHQLDGRR